MPSYLDAPLGPVVSELPSKNLPARCVLLLLRYPLSLLIPHATPFLLSPKCHIYPMLPPCLWNFRAYVNSPRVGFKIWFFSPVDLSLLIWLWTQLEAFRTWEENYYFFIPHTSLYTFPQLDYTFCFYFCKNGILHTRTSWCTLVITDASWEEPAQRKYQWNQKIVHASDINIDKQRAARYLYPEDWIYHGTVLRKSMAWSKSYF